MWILPKQLISAFVPDTAALISDLNEQSQICGQSLLVRSKVLPARTWSLKWKRDSWTQHLSGRILKHSHGRSFTERWISSLGDTHASHLAQLASDSAPKTRATFGHSLQMELGSCSPEFASLKTLKDTSASDLEESLQNWNQWVTQSRGEYSARLKSAPRTSESGCLSWPTVTANEDSYRIGGNSQSSNCLSAMSRRGEMYGQHDQANPSTNGSLSELWPTAMSRDWKDTGDMSQSMTRKDGKKRMDILGRAVQANPSTNGSLPESWATPRSGKLNPRWVETLMGLPVGWTMPSCASPVTIEPTNSDCSATA